MDMYLMILLPVFLGFVLYELWYNTYVHLVIGSILTDITNMFKKKNTTKTRKKKVNN